MDKIQVGYNRKASTDDYGSIGLSGMVEFQPASDDLQKEFDQAFLHLKLIVDAKMEELGIRSGGVFDAKPVVNNTVTQEEPDLGEEPDWVAAKVAEVEARGIGPTIPPRPDAIPQRPRPVQGPPQGSQETDNSAETPQRTNEATKPSDGEVFLGKAKVFRSNMKRDRNNKPYAELRVGHEDLKAHINDGYVTVKIWDPEYSSVVGSLERVKVERTGEIKDQEQMNIVKNDFVDLWGKFQPWFTDNTKFDLIASAIQKHKN